tara:strand:- start:93 stop:671 length:579 start_codon:yes stop_codon:yes gene_type:complete
MNLTEIITILASIFALFIPLILSFYERNSKLREAVYLKELIKTRNDLKGILIETNINDQQILHEKLESMLSNIDEEINKSKAGFSKKLEFFLLGSISFILIFLSMEYHGNRDGINEGIFNSPVPRSVLSIIVMILSFAISDLFSKILKRYYTKRDWRSFYIRITLLCIIYPIFHLIILKCLSLLDDFVGGMW